MAWNLRFIEPLLFSFIYVWQRPTNLLTEMTMTLRPYGADWTKFDRGFIEMLGIAKQQKQLMWHASNENYGNYRCFFFWAFSQSAWGSINFRALEFDHLLPYHRIITLNNPKNGKKLTCFFLFENYGIRFSHLYFIPIRNLSHLFGYKFTFWR